MVKKSEKKVNPNLDSYDVLIIGGGPAGISASIYAKRFGLRVALITREIGGDWAGAHKICNYPGFKEISGSDLAQKMLEHVQSQEVPIIYDEVKEIFKEKDFFKVKTNSKSITARKIIFSTGSSRKKLEVKGEKNFLGKGVSYCATCDGPFFKNKVVAVIGGGNAAISAAILLAEYAEKVYVIYRRDSFFRPEEAMLKILNQNKKIEKIFNEELQEISGKTKVESINLKNSNKTIEVGGVFIEIGGVPNLNLISSLGIKLNDSYILVNENQETNINGFYAAGDVTSGSFKQIVVAASQGAIAASHAYKEIKKANSNQNNPLTQY